LFLFQRYMLVVNGEPPDGLAGPSGVFLDGRGNGMPGSDYVKSFGPGILAGAYFRINPQAQGKIRHAPSADPLPKTAHLQSPRDAWARPIERVQIPVPKGGLVRLAANAVDAVLGTLDSPLEIHGRFRTRSRNEN
jgi:hypothetical protein